MVCNAELQQCDRTVRKLCNAAAKGVTYHDKWNGIKNNAILFSGVYINTYLQLFNTGYGVDSKNGITTVANAVDEDKMYYVCKNYKDKIGKVVDESPRRSVQLNPQTRTPIAVTDDTTLRVWFDFEDGREEYKEVTYDDALEEEKERSNRVGYCTNFPKQVLSFNFRKPFGKINYREKQRRSNFLVKELIANCVDRKKLESQGMEYLEGNIPLAKQVLAVLDMVQYSIS